jgi:chemotaxis signal transduction protein
MSQSVSTSAGSVSRARPARVLVFTVDDGLFAIHLDWVEAVYPQAAVPIHAIKVGAHRRPFILHHGEPALISDLREAFGLEQALGKATRAELVVIRSGSILLALPSDGSAGVRELDFRSQTPLPTRLLRDGDVPVGHVVELDAKMLVVLDPNRLVDGPVREGLLAVHRKAVLFQQREEKRMALWTQICERPSAADVRAYARLCGRNGRGKAAAAARAVLKCMVDSVPSADGGASEPALLAEVMGYARSGHTGELVVEVSGEAEPGRLFMVGGHVIDAQYQDEHGRAAFKQLLAQPSNGARTGEVEMAARAEAIPESTVALGIWALETLSSERRGRRSR